MRRYATDAQIKRAAMLARELGVELELRPDGSMRVNPTRPQEPANAYERMMARRANA